MNRDKDDADDWLDDDELDDEGLDEEDVLVEEPAQWEVLGSTARRRAALRAIEIAREERALRHALDDFPYDDLFTLERHPNHERH